MHSLLRTNSLTPSFKESLEQQSYNQFQKEFSLFQNASEFDDAGKILNPRLAFDIAEKYVRPLRRVSMEEMLIRGSSVDLELNFSKKKDFYNLKEKSYFDGKKENKIGLNYLFFKYFQFKDKFQNISYAEPTQRDVNLMRILFDKSVSIDLHGEILNIDLAIEVLIKYPKEIHRFSIESVFRNMFENLSLYDLDRSKKRFFIAVIQADVIDIEFSLLNKDLILEVYRMDFPKKKFIQSLFKYSLSLNREHNQFMDLNYAKDILLHHAHSLNDKDIYDGIESVFVIIELTKEWDEQLSFLLTALKNILKRLSTNSYNRKALLKLELWEEKLKKRQQQQH